MALEGGSGDAPGNRRYLVPGAGGLTDRPIIKEIGDRLQVVWI